MNPWNTILWYPETGGCQSRACPGELLWTMPSYGTTLPSSIPYVRAPLKPSPAVDQQAYQGCLQEHHSVIFFYFFFSLLGIRHPAPK